MTTTLTWLGQAGYVLRCGDASLAIDPYFSDSIAGGGFVRLYPASYQKGELQVNAVLSTHNHGDHLDVETLRDYIGFDRFYGPGTCVQAMKNAGFPEAKLNKLDRGETAQEGPFKLTAVYAEHTEDSIGVVVECEGMRLYFTGDSLMHEKLYDAAALQPDVLFVCINGKFGNMNWQEAVDLAKGLKVKTAIPAHYDMFAINMEKPELFTGAFADGPIASFELERDKVYSWADLVTPV